MPTFAEVPTKVDFPALERELLAWWEREGIVEQVPAPQRRAERALLLPRRPDHRQQPDGRPPRLGPHLQGPLPALPRHARRTSSATRTASTARACGSRSRSRRSSGFKSKRDIEALRHRRVRRALQGARAQRSPRIQTEQSIRLGYWMDWDNSLLHDVGREQLHDLELPQEVPRARLDLQGPRRDALVPALRHRHLRARDRHRGLPGAHPPLASSSRFPLRDEPGDIAARLDDDALDAGRQRRRRRQPGADLRQGRAGRPTSLPRRRTRPSTRSAASTRSLGELHGRRAGRPALPRPVRRAAGRSTASSIASSPGTRSSEAEGTGIVHIAPGCGKEDFALSKEHDLRGDRAARRVRRLRRRLRLAHRRSTSHDVADADRRRPAREGAALPRPSSTRTATRSAGAARPSWSSAWSTSGSSSMDELRAADDGRHARRSAGSPSSAWSASSTGCEHGRLDDLQEALLGPGAADLRVRGLRRLRGDRQRDGAEGARRRGLGRVRGPHAAPAVDRRGQDRLREVRRDRSAASRTSATPGSTPASCRSRRCSYRHDRDYWEKWFPADFITESFPGQFRNWFYSLLAMSTVLEDRTAVRTSSRLRPGARREGRGDAQVARATRSVRRRGRGDRRRRRCAGCSATPTPTPTSTSATTSPTRCARRFILPLWNTYAFFVTYARLDGFDPTDAPSRCRWPSGRCSTAGSSRGCNQLIGDGRAPRSTTTTPDAAARAIERFVVDELSNWYIRRNRRRFWKSESDARQAGRLPDALRVPDDADAAAGAVHALPGRGDVPEPRPLDLRDALRRLHLAQWLARLHGRARLRQLDEDDVTERVLREVGDAHAHGGGAPSRAEPTRARRCNGDPPGSRPSLRARDRPPGSGHWTGRACRSPSRCAARRP